MAFERERTNRPVAVGRVRIEFSTEFAGDGIVGKVQCELLNDEGDVVRWPERELVSHMTAAQVTNVTNFIENVRQRIVDEMLPVAEPSP